MHALQVLPLVVMLLELASRRFTLLGSESVRLRLVRIAVAAFTATLAVLTLQAISGQSIVHPDGLVLALGVLVAVGSAGAVLAVLASAARAASSPA